MIIIFELNLNFIFKINNIFMIKFNKIKSFLVNIFFFKINYDRGHHIQDYPIMNFE